MRIGIYGQCSPNLVDWVEFIVPSAQYLVIGDEINRDVSGLELFMLIPNSSLLMQFGI